MTIKSEEQILICNIKLPIQVVKHEGKLKIVSSSSIIMNYLYNLSQKNTLVKTIWIGNPGIFPKTELERQEIDSLLKPHNCIPVFID
jgi:hypothetical protein